MDAIIFLVNLYTTSGLSIVLRGVISLPDPTSYDKIRIKRYFLVLLNFYSNCLILEKCANALGTDMDFLLSMQKFVVTLSIGTL